jgi:hypothetical protein
MQVAAMMSFVIKLIDECREMTSLHVHFYSGTRANIEQHAKALRALIAAAAERERIVALTVD